MAKTAKPKKRQQSTHSRAARRATSPSLPTSTTTTTTRSSTTPPPHPASLKPHILAAQSTGVAKKPQKGKQMKRAQRLRQMRGMDRAEANVDKLALKVAKSVGREKRVRERRRGWEEVNGGRVGKGKGNGFAGLEEEDGEEGKGRREWGRDEEMGDGDGREEVAPEVMGQGKEVEVVVPASVPLPVEGEDEML